MIEIYCRAHHHPSDRLCAECQALLAYAMQRIDKCPFHEAKPTCAKCPVHCYRPAMRGLIRDVMRYAGPRMLFSHPILTAYHFLDELAGPKAPGSD